jgi:hypothetical protein
MGPRVCDKAGFKSLVSRTGGLSVGLREALGPVGGSRLR